MNCLETQNRLEDFLSGKLRGEESRTVRIHLASCKHCASALSSLDRIETFTALDEEIEPSESLHSRFMTRLNEHRLQSKTAKRPSQSWWRIFGEWSWSKQLVAATALASILVLGVYWGVYIGSAPVPGTIAGDIAIAENLTLLRDMKVIENLDLLEDFDAIRQLYASGPTPSTVQ